jgi:hypothetical protein
MEVMTAPTDDSDPVLVERVHTGMQVLDEHQPGWLDTIDLAHLDLASNCMCVLGQIYRDFDLGIEELEHDGVNYMAWEMGFDVHAGEIHDEAQEKALDREAHGALVAHSYTELDHVWKREILARRQEQES